VSADGTKVYIANFGGGGPASVSIIDTDTRTVVATLTDVRGALSVAVTPDRSKLYVGDLDGVSIFDLSTNLVIKKLAIGRVDGLVMSADGTRLYTTLRPIIDTITDTVVATLPVGAGAIARAGNRLYMVQSATFVVDIPSNTVVAVLNAGGFIPAVAASVDGSRVYVADFNATVVKVVDTATNTIVADIPSGSGIGDVDVAPNGENIYVTVFNGSAVHVHDAATGVVVASVATSRFPFRIAVGPALPVSPTALLGSLTAFVQSLDLSNGISNSLDAKLQTALQALNAARAGDVISACNQVGAFLNQVAA